MAATKRNCELKKKKQLFIEFPFILLNNLKFVERTQHNSVVQNIHCAPHFAAPWTVAPPPALINVPAADSR